MKLSGIGTGEDGIVRWRTAMKNEEWCMDFPQKRTAERRPVHMLAVPDEHTRSYPAINGVAETLRRGHRVGGGVVQ